MRKCAACFFVIIGLILLSSCSGFSLFTPSKETVISPSLTPFNTIYPTQTVTATLTTVPTTPAEISVTRADCQRLTIDWQSTPSENPYSDKPRASIAVSEVESLTQAEIEIILLCQYMEKHISPVTEDEWQIEDYRIEIEPAGYSRGLDEILISVEFYVLPVNPDQTGWIAGSAARLEEGWIVNGSYTSITKNQENYELGRFFNG